MTRATLPPTVVTRIARPGRRPGWTARHVLPGSPARTPQQPHRTERERLGRDDVVALRSTLEQQRSFRLEQLAHLRLLDGDDVGEADREIVTSLTTSARCALREIDEALDRVGTGRYGRCVACGLDVEAERLEILPQVARCMPCQRAADVDPSIWY